MAQTQTLPAVISNIKNIGDITLSFPVYQQEIYFYQCQVQWLRV
jgi:hypothetical protein